MNEYAIFDASGRISRVYSGPLDQVSLQLEDGEDFSAIPPGLDDLTAYVEGGQVVPKQELSLPGALEITANGQDEAIIDNIPAGVSVTWPDGQIDEVTDGEVRFSVDLPGTYTLRFTAVEYLDKEVTIEAVPATES